MKYYAVYKGFKTGVYENWEECVEQVKGYSMAMYKKCDNLNEAEYYYKNGSVKPSPKYEDLSKYFGGGVSNEKNDFSPWESPNMFDDEIPVSSKASKASKATKATKSTKATSNKVITKSSTPPTPPSTSLSRSSSKSPILVYTDGGCINNGRPNALAGIGVFFGNGDIRNVSRRFPGKQSNNTAETNAMIDVSVILKKEIADKREVHIYYDSDYAMKACTSYGRKLASNGWTDKKPNLELVKKAYMAFKDKPNIKFKHIKAHTGKQDCHSLGNEGADMLATMAIGTSNKPKPSSQSKNKSQISNADNIYLKVPYSNKDDAKQLGAIWNPKKKKWYIPNNHRHAQQLIMKYGCD